LVDLEGRGYKFRPFLIWLYFWPMKIFEIVAIFSMAMLLFSCQNTNMLVDNMDIQGHRGCRGLMPENTIPGFIRALEAGVNTLEMDVGISQDNEVIVSHDPFFHHHISTAPNGDEITESNMLSHNIYKLNYEQVKQYDVGLKAHPKFPIQRKIPAIKPKLSMVFDTVEAYIKNNNLHPVQYSIELKRKGKYDKQFHPAGEEFSDLVIEIVDRYELADRVILQCFDVETLQIIRKKRPEINLAYLIEKEKDYVSNIEVLGFVPEIYSPAFRLVNTDLVNYCNDKGMKVIPWTINDVDDLEYIMKLGVHGVISDYPDRALEIYKGLQLSKG